MAGVGDASLRREYRRRMLRLLRVRREPEVLLIYALKCAIHVHVHALTQAMTRRGGGGPGNTF
jgi:hypothetical protein